MIVEIDASVLIKKLIEAVGDDPGREGLVNTPERVMNSWKEIYAGYRMDPEHIFTTFSNEKTDEIVLLKDFEFYSICEHHMLPFFGKAHVAYLPGKRIAGVSKLARLVDIYAKRLQIQESITEQVTEALMKYLEPKGAACILEAKHLCMCMRGVNKQNSMMVTSSMKGVFKDSKRARSELLELIKL